MAIFSFKGDVVSRKAGQNAVTKAAYNNRDKLTGEYTGEVKDFRRAEGLLFSGIYFAGRYLQNGWRNAAISLGIGEGIRGSR